MFPEFSKTTLPNPNFCRLDFISLDKLTNSSLFFLRGITAAAVIPLKKNNEELVNLSKEIKSNLQKLGLGRVVLENSGNIGKNYRRHDEIGTPICLTVDFETLEDKSVTVRDRDTMKQERVSIENLSEYYKKYFN